MRRKGKKLGIRTNRSLKREGLPHSKLMSDTITKFSNKDEKDQLLSKKTDDLKSGVVYSLNKKKRWQIPSHINKLDEDWNEEDNTKLNETHRKPRTRKERRELEHKSMDDAGMKSRSNRKFDKFGTITKFGSGSIVLQTPVHWNIKRRSLQYEIDEGKDIYEIETFTKTFPIYTPVDKYTHDRDNFIDELVHWGELRCKKSIGKIKGRNKYGSRHRFYDDLGKIFQ